MSGLKTYISILYCCNCWYNYECIFVIAPWGTLIGIKYCIVLYCIVYRKKKNEDKICKWHTQKRVGVPGENHSHVATHWQTLSHNVISSTPCTKEECVHSQERTVMPPLLAEVNRCITKNHKGHNRQNWIWPVYYCGKKYVNISNDFLKIRWIFERNNVMYYRYFDFK